MRPLGTMQKINNTLGQLLQYIIVFVFLVLVIDVTWGVMSRHLFQHQIAWSEELARLLMVWLALLGAALASRDNLHIGLDVLFRTWPKELQRVGLVFINCTIILFGSIIMGWGGTQLVLDRLASGQTLPALGISKSVFYLALPVSGFLISLFAIEALLTSCFRSINEEGNTTS